MPAVWLAALGLPLGAAPALAQSRTTSQLSGLKMSGDQPIQIESDKLEVREADSVAVFSGNVSVVQGPTLLKAGKMTVYYVKDADAAAKGEQAAGPRPPAVPPSTGWRSTTRSMSNRTTR